MSEVFDINKVRTDCLYFKGDLPCKPHKESGYQCTDCPEYKKISKRILIVKLGAIGDVIRTTPLLHKIRTEYPNAKVTWLTLTPAILPSGEIEEILSFDLKSILYIKGVKFDIAINLDKDKEACALFNEINAGEKFGYCLKDGIPYPVNELAHHKYSTGISDTLSLANKKSYMEELFEIVGWQFKGEEYIFDNHSDKGFKWEFNSNKKLIGLNTGCGDRWVSRLWSDEKWLKLISYLKDEGFEPVLLGGKQEDERNKVLSKEGNVLYPGYFSLPQFINLMDQMDLIVTQVTMAMHIAIALKKKLVLMNNIFNPHEFYLYNRGQIVSPDKNCECFYRGTCKHGVSCMEDLPAEKVYKAVKELVFEN